MPAAAIAPWQGPGQETDIRRWALSWAIMAPHSHNLQSWLVDLNTPDQIVLRCDLSRLLPETDPFSRQIMMSHGCFLELLDIAARARGMRTEVTLFPEGPFGSDKLDRRAVARVRLTPDADVKRDPLFDQIALRVAYRCVRSAAGPPSGVSLWSDRRLQGDEFEGADVGSGSNQVSQGSNGTSGQRS